MPTPSPAPKLYDVPAIAEMFGVSPMSARALMNRIGCFKEAKKLFVTDEMLQAYFASKQFEAQQSRVAHQPVARGRKPRKHFDAPIDHIPRWKELHPCD